ncbi:MAG: ABC transporter permease, partial [Jatrophihabitantaceae bacterium]
MSMPQGELEVASVGLITPVDEADVAIQGRSLRQIAWRRLKQDKVAMAGGVGIVLVTLTAILASQLNDLIGNQPAGRNSLLTSEDTGMPFGKFGGASAKHLLGVQPVDGQDILARLIAGARTSMMI